MAKLKKFVTTSIVFLFGNVFTKLLAFLLLPLYTNKFNPADYGQYGLVIVILNLVVPVIFVCSWEGSFRMTYHMEEAEDKHIVLNNGISLMILGTALFVAVAFVVNSIIKVDYFIFIVGYGIVMAWQYFFSFAARSLGDSKVFIVSGCINSLIVLSINAIMIGIYNKGIEVAYISFIIGTIVQIIILEWRNKILSKYKIEGLSIKQLKKIISFSFPVSINSVMQWLLLGFTQFIISSELGTYFNGQFNVANKFSALVILLTNTIQFAWYELAYELAEDKTQRKKYYVFAISTLLKALLWLYPLIVFGIRFVYPIIGEAYQESLQIVPILILGTVLSSYAGFLGTIFLAYEESKTLTLSIMLGGVTNVVLSFVFISRYQLIGATTIYLIANCVLCGIRILQLKKKRNISPQISILPFLSTIAAMILFYCLDTIPLAIYITIYILCLGMVFKKQLIMIVGRIRKK